MSNYRITRANQLVVIIAFLAIQWLKKKKKILKQILSAIGKEIRPAILISLDQAPVIGGRRALWK